MATESESKHLSVGGMKGGSQGLRRKAEDAEREKIESSEINKSW